MLAFGKTEGHGSLHFRLLAKSQRTMMRFARVSAPNSSSLEPEASKWRAMIGSPSPFPPPPFFIVLRGPGAEPEVIKPTSSSGKGAIAEVEKLITSKGLFWQHLPALRPSTQSSLGCGSFESDASRNNGNKQQIVELCVVLMAPKGIPQRIGRANALKVSSLLNSLHSRDGKGSTADDLVSIRISNLLSSGSGGVKVDVEGEKRIRAAARSIAEGKLRVTWMDAEAQREFCAYHFEQNQSESDGNEMQGGSGRRTPCIKPLTFKSLLDISTWMEALGPLVEQVTGKKLWSHKDESRKKPAYLMAFRPVANAVSRDALGRPIAPSKRFSYVYSVLESVDLADPALDLSEPYGSRGGDMRDHRLKKVIDWLAQSHSAALEAPKMGSGNLFGQAAKPPPHPLQASPLGQLLFPPPLIPDDRPSILDRLSSFAHDSKSFISRTLILMGIDVSSLSPSREFYGTVAILVLLVVVQMIWSRVAGHSTASLHEVRSSRERTSAEGDEDQSMALQRMRAREEMEAREALRQRMRGTSD
jgi:hypothetical protein